MERRASCNSEYYGSLSENNPSRAQDSSSALISPKDISSIRFSSSSISFSTGISFFGDIQSNIQLNSLINAYIQSNMDLLLTISLASFPVLYFDFPWRQVLYFYSKLSNCSLRLSIMSRTSKKNLMKCTEIIDLSLLVLQHQHHHLFLHPTAAAYFSLQPFPAFLSAAVSWCRSQASGTAPYHRHHHLQEKPVLFGRLMLIIESNRYFPIKDKGRCLLQKSLHPYISGLNAIEVSDKQVPCLELTESIHRLQYNPPLLPFLVLADLEWSSSLQTLPSTDQPKIVPL